jgi:hypothetical protein
MEIQRRSDRDQNGIMIDSYKTCQGALLGLFSFYVAFRLHSFILRLDALFFIHQSTPQHKPVMGGRCFGKARPNQYQSTPQPLPKHILRVCFGVCWGVLWHWWGRAFQSVLWSSQSVLWRRLGCALLRVGVPKKSETKQKNIPKQDPKRTKNCSKSVKKALVPQPLKSQISRPPKIIQNLPKMIPK